MDETAKSTDDDHPPAPAVVETDLVLGRARVGTGAGVGAGAGAGHAATGATVARSRSSRRKSPVDVSKAAMDAVEGPGSGGDNGLGLESHADTEPQIPHVSIEVLLEGQSGKPREEYVVVYSDIVDHIIAEAPQEGGELWYNVEFTDGREDLASLDELLTLPNGRRALNRHHRDFDPVQEPAVMARTRRSGRKRTRDVAFADESEAEPSEQSDSEGMDLIDLANEPDRDFHPRPTKQPQSIARRLRPSTNGQTRQSTRQSSAVSTAKDNAASPSEDDDDDASIVGVRRPRRRAPRLTLSTMRHQNHGRRRDEDQDELALDHQESSDNDNDNDTYNDADFAIVVSDLVKTPSKGKRRARSKRLRARAAAATGAAAGRSRGSSIEFEQPRRSGRSTRNTRNMEELAAMDEESFFIDDDRAPAEARIASVREIFKPSPPDSDFASVHSAFCDTCNGGPSPNKGGLIGCQGCSLSYHKPCLGTRQAREHLVTKIGPDEFVLQCRHCINKAKKKESLGPSQDTCQVCKVPGLGCRPMSQRKTAKQEEKLRLENGGQDPSEDVPPGLVNNADNVLFRCTTCYRPWHVEHLPTTRTAVSDVTSIREARLDEYSVDWKCNECHAATHKVHRLVAWRPSDKDVYLPGQTFVDFDDDAKEYLVKWEGRSYFHCRWMPGAWVFGFVSPASRSAFGRRSEGETQLPKFDEKEAIPDEYLMADVILSAKVDRGPHAKTIEGEMARIGMVTKIYVKFQGLSYDEVVWDSPPDPGSGPVYDAFRAAYREYLAGKYFKNEPVGKIKERIKAFKSSPFARLTEQPRGLKRGKLMEYQLQGVTWLLSKFYQGHSAVLADEMGLGKTIQIIGLITTLVQDDPRCWPFLVVVPNSTCPNWRREIKQWSPDLRVVTYHGGKQPQDLAYNYELFPDGSPDMRAHVVVMSYDSAQDERTRTLFKNVHWAGLIVDEGQRLKNDQNLLYLALRAMRIPFRILLTGTPLQNNKRELFNLVQFVDESQSAVRLDEEYQELTSENIPKLHALINPYFIRRTKAQVLKFLPPMSQIIVPVSMTIVQEKLCKSIIAKNPDLIRAVFSNNTIRLKERGSLNNILMQLRKCLCHPFIYSEAVEERSSDPEVMHRNLVSASGKLLLLDLMLPKLKADNHRVLIFSQFLNQLDIIEDFLAGLGLEYRRLDGQIPSLEKQKRIDAFNAPGSTIFAFLLSTRAGGVGINLATADTVIILDPDFNPHQDIQALSRAHRIGQKDKVLCIQLMTKNSIEEKMMQIGRKKMALDHVLIERMDQEDSNPSDLESILKHGAEALFNDEQKEEAIHYDAASVDKLLNRDDMEATPVGEDKSAESQFSFAKIWANSTGTFDVAMPEHEEPTALDASVWESILAEREAEAQRAAEMNREILGRGGRRRQAVNYKTKYAAEDGVADGDSSGEDDDFAQPDSGDEDEDEDGIDGEKAKGKAKKSPTKSSAPVEQPTTPRKKSAATPVSSKKTVNKKNTQPPKKLENEPGTPPSKATPRKAIPNKATPSKATPSKATPSKAIPSKATPKATPKKATLAKATPTKATPGRATPAKATPTKATPTKATPTKATPTKATPAKATPKRATPAKATPAKANRVSKPSAAATPKKARKAQLENAVGRSETLGVPKQTRTPASSTTSTGSDQVDSSSNTATSNQQEDRSSNTTTSNQQEDSSSNTTTSNQQEDSSKNTTTSNQQEDSSSNTTTSNQQQDSSSNTTTSNQQQDSSSNTTTSNQQEDSRMDLDPGEHQVGSSTNGTSSQQEDSPMELDPGGHQGPQACTCPNPQPPLPPSLPDSHSCSESNGVEPQSHMATTSETTESPGPQEAQLAQQAQQGLTHTPTQ